VGIVGHPGADVLLIQTTSVMNVAIEDTMLMTAQGVDMVVGEEEEEEDQDADRDPTQEAILAAGAGVAATAAAGADLPR
jgi:hypothetical protein